MQDLYQELIIDHGTNPRNKKKPEHYDCTAYGNNPLCGDKINIYVIMDKGSPEKIASVSFDGDGCAISTASASILSEAMVGQSIAEAKILFNNFVDTLTKSNANPNLPIKLEALKGVKQYPMRVKCATLAWHTLVAALDYNKSEVSTE